MKELQVKGKGWSIRKVTKYSEVPPPHFLAEICEDVNISFMFFFLELNSELWFVTRVNLYEVATKMAVAQKYFVDCPYTATILAATSYRLAIVTNHSSLLSSKKKHD